MDDGKRPVQLVAVATGPVLPAMLAAGLVVGVRSDGASAAARVEVEPIDALVDVPLRLEVDGARTRSPSGSSCRWRPPTA